MTAMTQAEFAVFCGVGRSTVTRWLRAGRIQALPNGLIDAVPAAKMREATASPLPMHLARRAQFADEPTATGPTTPPATGATQAPDAPQADFVGSGGGEAMPQAEKLGIALKLEAYKGQKTRNEISALELDKLIGTLVDRAEVDFVLADFGNTLRALLESLPDRLAGQLAALRGDTNAIHKALEDALHDTLQDMAENMKRKTEGLNP